MRSDIREYVEAFVLAVVVTLFVLTFVAQSFLVQGSSMEPTLFDGQRLVVDKLSYRFTEPRRGEIVVFRYPGDPRRKFIKRVIGIPGDEIVIADGVVYRNGLRLAEYYVQGPTRGAYHTPGFGAVTVPPASYFVLGDNRRNSDDSRYPDVGFVSQDHLVGKALLVYWPLHQGHVLGIPGSRP